jgi:hypothetical protein
MWYQLRLDEVCVLLKVRDQEKSHLQVVCAVFLAKSGRKAVGGE